VTFFGFYNCRRVKREGGREGDLLLFLLRKKRRELTKQMELRLRGVIFIEKSRLILGGVLC
jgi:hypothetical protein